MARFTISPLTTACLSLLLLYRSISAQNFCSFSMNCNCQLNGDNSYSVYCIYFNIFPTFSPFNGTIKLVEVTGKFTSVPPKAFYNLQNFPNPTVTFYREVNFFDPLTIDDDAFLLTNSQQRYASITFENYKNFSVPTTALAKIAGVDVLKFYEGQYDTIPDNAFNGVQSGSINFIFCTISSVAPEAFNGLIIPPDYQNEVIIDFELNNLVEVPQAIRSVSDLTYLFLDSNQISQIRDSEFCSVDNCPSLRTVRLESNLVANISDHAFDSVPGLSRLVLSNNRLTTLPTLPLANLFELSLDNNQLTVAPMTALQMASGSLYKLTLDSNRITGLGVNTFVGFTQLQTVTLDFNPIITIAPGAFNSVPWYSLTLSNLTDLPTVDALVTYGMPNVQSLTISQCPSLVNVTMDSLEKVPQTLKLIRVSNTGLRSLDPQLGDWLKASKENILDISFNSNFFCNTSDIEWMAAPAICEPPQIQMQNTFCGDTKLSLFAVLDVAFSPYCP